MHVEHGGTTRNITADYLQIKVTLQAERDGDLQLSISRDLLNATGILPYYDSDYGFQGAVFVDSIDSLDYTTVQTEKAVGFGDPDAEGFSVEFLGRGQVVNRKTTERFRRVQHVGLLSPVPNLSFPADAASQFAAVNLLWAPGSPADVT